MSNDDNIDAALKQALTQTLQKSSTSLVDGIAISMNDSYKPMTFYDELQQLERENRAIYQMLLENYAEEHPEYLAYADSYARIAAILKDLMS